MPRYSAKQKARVDVLVLGDHPSAYFAAVLLKQKTKYRVVHTAVAPRQVDDRLMTINSKFFDLHPLLSGLGRSLSMVSVHGLQFLSDKADTKSEYRAKGAMVHVVRYRDVHDQMAKLAETYGVETLGTHDVQIHGVDEQGLHVTAGKHDLTPSALILAGELSGEQKTLLQIPDSWGPDVVHRITICRCRGIKHLNHDGKHLMPMSLDLCGQLCWGWLIPGDGEFQIAVEQPIEKATARSGAELLQHWVGVLQSHGVLDLRFEFPESSVRTTDLPLAGALAQEGVGNRTLLIGPAGGFYSACGEEIYPSCWSAVFAADVMKKALKERHLQDALNPYRQQWRTTLGDYLRGPQQNLRFLLPLVYRNPAMTARLAEAILLSKSVVR